MYLSDIVHLENLFSSDGRSSFNKTLCVKCRLSNIFTFLISERVASCTHINIMYLHVIGLVNVHTERSSNYITPQREERWRGRPGLARHLSRIAYIRIS